MAQSITDIFLVTARDNDLTTFILETTLKGNDGDLWDNTWTKKAKRYIGFKRCASDEYVVTDLCIIPEDTDIPDDYAGLLITKDTKEKGLRKHILCYKRDSRKSVDKALTDIVVLNPSKGEQVPPFFMSMNKSLSEKSIAFKMEALPKTTSPPVPSRVPAAARRPEIHDRRQSSVGSPSGGIDGIPFQINPKFDSKAMQNDPIVNGINILSLDEIDKKYSYSFDKERQTLQGR